MAKGLRFAPAGMNLGRHPGGGPMTNELTTKCACCGRRVEAGTLSVLLPKALIEHVEKAAKVNDVEPGSIVQEALDYWLRISKQAVEGTAP
jgi:hypothetical protein